MNDYLQSKHSTLLVEKPCLPSYSAGVSLTLLYVAGGWRAYDCNGIRIIQAKSVCLISDAYFNQHPCLQAVLLGARSNHSVSCDKSFSFLLLHRSQELELAEDFCERIIYLQSQEPVWSRSLGFHPSTIILPDKREQTLECVRYTLKPLLRKRRRRRSQSRRCSARYRPWVFLACRRGPKSPVTRPACRRFHS